MTRAFVTRTLSGDVLERLKAAAVEVDVWPDDSPPPYEVLRERIREADGLLCMLTDRVDADLLDAAPKLRVISQCAVGVDNIDLEAATERGIPVGHTPGVLTETTAELTWALILATARRLPEAERFLRHGEWKTWSLSLLLGMDLGGQTLGIVGMGAIGRAVARRASAFDMEVLYTARTDKHIPGADRVELHELMARSDVVSIHCAVTSETRGLIGEQELALMKPTAILVNTARGGIVDEAALVHTLETGEIFAAGLDVYATEPLPMDSPFLQLNNLVLLPHIGSASIRTRERMASLAVKNLLAGLRGDPLLHRANRENPARAGSGTPNHSQR